MSNTTDKKTGSAKDHTSYWKHKRKAGKRSCNKRSRKAARKELNNAI